MKFRSILWYNFKIIPDVKFPYIIRRSVISNGANYDIHDISVVKPQYFL